MLSLDQQNALLTEVFSRLAGLGHGVRPDGSGPPGLDVERFAATLRAISDLTEDLWDLEPCLVSAEDAPSFSRDLSAALHILDTNQHSFVRQDVLMGLFADLPEPIVQRIRDSPTERERIAIVRTWWEAQPRPFEPFEKIDRELASERRWRRLHAAACLREIQGPNLVDEARGDIDPEALRRWRSTRRGQIRLVTKRQ